MTMHYSGKNIEDMTPELILSGWKYHGNQMPLAFGVFSEGDWVAYNCWHYLSLEKKPKVSEFCKNILPKDKKIKLIKIMKEVVAKHQASSEVR